MPDQIVLEPIGIVHSPVTEPIDDAWDAVQSRIDLDQTRFPAECLAGLDEFSHIEVVSGFHRVAQGEICIGARRPRGRSDWPLVGIFAQRGKNRPNRIGVTVCRLLSVSGTSIEVVGLDAIDGTPVLDIKPYMREFAARGAVRQPRWSSELMSGYWKPSRSHVDDSEPGDVEIRTLHRGDAAAAWRLRLEALEQEPFAFSTAAEEHRATSVEAMAARLDHSTGDSFVLGAFSDGQLQGMMGFIRNHQIKLRHKGVIWGVYVSPALRGQGAGRALMQACLDRAAALDGLRQVKLGVAQANTAARALYESFGFVVYGEELGSLLVAGELCTELHMVLRLAG